MTEKDQEAFRQWAISNGYGSLAVKLTHERFSRDEEEAWRIPGLTARAISALKLTEKEAIGEVKIAFDKAYRSGDLYNAERWIKSGLAAPAPLACSSGRKHDGFRSPKGNPQAHPALEALDSLTLFAMIATVTLMTLRFSPLHPVLLVVQTLLLVSQVMCIKKLKAGVMTCPLITSMSGQLTRPVGMVDTKIYLDGPVKFSPLGALIKIGDELMEVTGHHAEGLYVNRGMKATVVECHVES